MAEQIFKGVLRWEAPPPIDVPDTRAPRRAWAIVAMDLREHPGKWGLIDEDCGNSASTTSRINDGKAAWWQPAGAYLAVQRTVNGSVNVYAVYLGPNHEYAAMAGVHSKRNQRAA